MNKKNLTVFAMTAICVVGLNACASKTEATTAAETTVTETTVTETTVTESAATTVAEKVTTDTAIGTIDTTGKYTSPDGAYEITLPKGWGISPDSESDLVCFHSADKKDLIEIIYENGDDSVAILEKFPETADEYNKTTLKDCPAKEITKYNIIKDEEEGVEVFQIYCKYDVSEGKTPYTFTARSGVQDATNKLYYAASALIQSEGMEDTITKAIDSFAILKIE